MAAVAVLPDGRVVAGGWEDGQVRIWDPASAGETRPVTFGYHRAGVAALTALPDGRVISGGREGRVVITDPAAPRQAGVVLGRHSGKVVAVAVLPDGQVATGGEDRQVRVWNLDQPGTRLVQIECSVSALAATRPGAAVPYLVIAHEGLGFSTWSLTM